MSASFSLYRLQQADTRLAQAHVRRKAVEHALQDDAETRAASLNHHAAQEAKMRAEAGLQQAQRETQTTRLKLEQAEASLYGGRVGNPKELQDLQKDVESLKRHLAALEDVELEAMLALEEAEQTEVAARASLDIVLAKTERDRRGLVTEHAQIQSEVARLESERQAIAGSIDAVTLDYYDTLRSQKRGVAVAALTEGTCNACGGPLTPGQQQAVHIGEGMLHCPTCGRLLYAG